MSKKLKNILVILLSTLLGAALTGWLYRDFDFGPVWHIFRVRDNYVWILLTLFFGVAANILRAFRWRMLLGSAGIGLRRRRAVELVFISYLINSVTPRLGEVVRALLAGRGDATVSTKALGTVVTEKAADVVCLLLVAGMAVALRPDEALRLAHGILAALERILPSGLLIAALAAISVLTVLALPRIRRLRQLFSELWQGISAIARLQNPWAFAGLCAAVWLCNFMQLFLLLPCYEALSGLGPADALYLFAAASVGALFPTPGGAGPWHYAVARTLTGVYATDGAVAKSFALVTHGLKTALVMLLGLLAGLTYYQEVAAWAWHNRRPDSKNNENQKN